jgi:transcriptional regulator with XRE-family HTH domain
MNTTWQNKAKARLKALGMTQDHLADQLDVSKGTVSHWLSGRHQPSISRLIRIAHLLEIPFAELIAHDDAICQNQWELSMLRVLRTIPPGQQGQVDMVLTTFAKGLGVSQGGEPDISSTPPHPEKIAHKT